MSTHFWNLTWIYHTTVDNRWILLLLFFSVCLTGFPFSVQLNLFHCFVFSCLVFVFIFCFLNILAFSIFFPSCFLFFLWLRSLNFFFHFLLLIHFLSYINYLALLYGTFMLVNTVSSSPGSHQSFLAFSCILSLLSPTVFQNLGNHPSLLALLPYIWSHSSLSCPHTPLNPPHNRAKSLY